MKRCTRQEISSETTSILFFSLSSSSGWSNMFGGGNRNHQRHTPTSSSSNRLKGRRREKDKHYFIQALIFLTRVVAMRYKWTRLYSSDELQTSYSCKSPVPNPQVALCFPGLAWKNSTVQRRCLGPAGSPIAFRQQLGWQCCGLKSPPTRS